MSFSRIVKEQAQFGLDSYSEDIEAINSFFLGVSPSNDAAIDVVSKEWFPFYDDWKQKGWFDKSFSKVSWDKARAIRDKYNQVNGTPAAPGALKAEDVGQAQPLGGLLGDVPSDLADKGAFSTFWKNIPWQVKAIGGVLGAGWLLKPNAVIINHGKK